jgi:hypothetical protein
MTQRFCKDCRWIEWHGPPFGQYSEAVCKHPSSNRPDTIDLVTGVVRAGRQEGCRSVRLAQRHIFNDQPACGPFGIFWEEDSTAGAQETSHLLSSSENAARLTASMQQAQNKEAPPKQEQPDE